MATINVNEMYTSMRIGTYSVTPTTTVAQLKTMILGDSGLGNEDMITIYAGGAVRGDSDSILEMAGVGGTVIVRFGPGSTAGGRRRSTRRRKHTRRH